MTARSYNLPDPGEGLTEAEIVTWNVAVGDEVAINDIVCEIETAKSVVELPTPYAGTVTALLVDVGETVDVGTPIITIEDRSDVSASPGTPAPTPEPATAPTAAEPTSAPPAPTPAAASGQAAPAQAAPVATLVGYGPRERAEGRRRRRTTPAAPAARSGEGQAARVLAKPPVRAYARELGVDLGDVTPSGADGVVRREDVTAHAGTNGKSTNGSGTNGTAPAPSVPPAGDGDETRVPVKGVRKATAEAMVASAFTAPHVTEWLTVDVSASMDLVARMKGERELADVKVTPLLLVARAVCFALRRTPEMNASFDDDAEEIVLRHRIHLGIAAATPRGLIVPVVRDADRLGMPELAQRVGEAVRTARDGKTQPSELAGGTFSITNVGVFGVDAGTPILVPGQTGILAVGAIKRRPWVVDETVVPRWTATLAVSFDHRVVDGAQGSRFLADVGRLLEDPSAAMTL